MDGAQNRKANRRDLARNWRRSAKVRRRFRSRAGWTFEHDHVRSFEPQFGGLDEQNSHRGGVGKNFRPIENLVVQSNRESAEAELARAFQQLMRGVIETIFRIVERVDVKIDFDPLRSVLVRGDSAAFLHVCQP